MEAVDHRRYPDDDVCSNGKPKADEKQALLMKSAKMAPAIRRSSMGI
jgi:hypothetical protein